MGSRGEIVEEEPPRVVEDKIYVAVGKELKEGESILRWAIGNSQGQQICILHVHQPADKILIMGTKFPIDKLEAHQVRTYHDIERQNMHQLLAKYNKTCQQAGVRVEVQHIEMDSIEKGIVEFILMHDVRKLVMGAAADKCFSRRMVEPRSRKAIYVRLQAAPSCQIKFICKGKLICTREARLDGINVGIASRSQNPMRSRSVVEELNSPTPDYRRVMSDNREI